MPIQKRLSAVGLAKQTAKGAPAAAPVYGLGVLGGSVLMIDVDQEAESIAYAQRVSPEENRIGVMAGANFRCRAHPRSVALLCYGALGAIVTTGVGPYTHAATPAVDLPYFTLFARMGAEYASIPDCKIDQLSISWSERRPIELEVVMLGRAPALGAAAWNPTNDEVGQVKFGGPGGTFKVDAAAAAAVAPVSGGRVQISNNLAGIPLSKDIVPDDIFPGEQAIETGATLIPEDFAEWRKILTGTGAGTAMTQVPVYGGFEHTFVDGASSLKLEASKTAFLADFPEADPAGGAAELELVGRVKKPTGATSALIVTIVNAVPSY